jgi:hypothetical protein
MPLVKDINYFLNIVAEAFRGFRRGTVWLMLFGYFVLMSILLYAYFNFLSPAFYPLAKATSVLGGATAAERFFHYPGHFLYLPAIFGWGKIFLTILLEGLVLGSAAILLRQSMIGVRSGGTRDKSLIHSWGHLMLASFSFNVIIIGIGILLPMALSPVISGYARRTLALELLVLPCLYAVIQALFFLVIPRIAIYGESFARAFVGSAKSFGRRPMTSFFLAVMVLFIPILIATAANHPDIIINKFYPELVFWVLWIGLGADLLANFLWMGAAARLLIDSES